jgi:hypothetical protein
MSSSSNESRVNPLYKVVVYWTLDMAITNLEPFVMLDYLIYERERGLSHSYKCTSHSSNIET